MKLQNLQISFHGKDHLEHRITYVNEHGTQCRDTLCSGEEFAQHVINCLEAVPLLTTERDGFRAKLSELSHKNEQYVCELDAYRAGNHPDLKPQLSEERYVLHGDIKPCTVLYSDDTTTLLRLPEGDMMCETDTIEWSDSVTYRCQELLRGESKRSGHRVSLPTVKTMAQLVRDERILLNDNGGEENPNAETIEVMGGVFVEALLPSSNEAHRCSECNCETNGSDCCAKKSEWTDNNSPTPLR